MSPVPSGDVPHIRTSPGLARVLFLVVAMTVWADVNDRLGARYHLGTATLIALRTVVDCGGVVWLGCIVWGKRSLRELGWRFPGPLRLIGIGLAQTAVIVGAIFAIVGLVGGLPAVRELAGDVGASSPGQHAFYGLLGVKIAFWEETLFRGDLLRALEERMGAVAALLASSAVFALYHLHLDDLAGGYRTVFTVGLAMKFLMGAVFATSAIGLRSLLPGAVAHALLWAIMCDN
jgi:membrane protease YdiL (CAAX protease family)